MLINKEKKIANRLRILLNNRGFIISIKYSKNSKSIYLKIDNGACGIIRISDHKNENTNCKYNVIKNYKGKRHNFYKGKIIKYYSYTSIGRLIADIESDRAYQIVKYGYANYKKAKNSYNYKKINSYAA